MCCNSRCSANALPHGEDVPGRPRGLHDPRGRTPPQARERARTQQQGAAFVQPPPILGRPPRGRTPQATVNPGVSVATLPPEAALYKVCRSKFSSPVEKFIAVTLASFVTPTRGGEIYCKVDYLCHRTGAGKSIVWYYLAKFKDMGLLRVVEAAAERPVRYTMDTSVLTEDPFCRQQDELWAR